MAENSESSPQLSPGWRIVKTGLNLMVIALVIIAISYAIVLLIAGYAGMLARGGRGLDPGVQGVLLLACIPGLAILVCAIMYMVGYVMCCFPPRESGVRGLVVRSVICLVIGFVIYLSSIILMFATSSSPFRNDAPRPQPGALLGILAFFAVAYVFYIVGWVLFVLFLRGVAKYFGNGKLARNCVTYLIITFMAIALSIVGFIFIIGANSVGGPRQGENWIVLLFGAASAVIGGVMMIWYLSLLVRTRNTIRRAMIEATSSPKDDS